MVDYLNITTYNLTRTNEIINSVWSDPIIQVGLIIAVLVVAFFMLFVVFGTCR